MNGQEIVGTMALILQVAVAGYAIWLHRVIPMKRAAWSLGIAFALMALMQVNDVRHSIATVSTLGLSDEPIYVAISLLLLLGLRHLQTEFQGRPKGSENVEQTLARFEANVDERTAELVGSNMKLAREMEQHKKLEGEIRASLEVYRGLVDSMDGIVFECRASDLAFIFVSPQSERLLGYRAENWLGQLTWRDLIHPDDYDRFNENIRTTPPIGKKPCDWLEYRVRTKDGQTRWIHHIARLIPGKRTGDDRIRGVLLDATERKQVTDELQQQQKLEAIGRLAGGVAHDFNNSLTVIQGYSQLLLSSKSLVADAIDPIKRISQASDQAARLTQQLLAFSRKQEIKPEPLDINAVIDNVSKMLRAIVGDAVSVHLNLAEQLPLVQGDAGQLGQVLVNLVVNARDAMLSGGQLVIQTELVTFGEVSTESDPEVRAGRFVCLGVSDTGVGIAPGARPHIFEPFFTTKGSGKATGLGLSTVYGIVKQHHGWVRVSSEVNQGTTFRLFLPTAPDKGRVEPVQLKEATYEANDETILLVDDEPAVLDLVKSILESHGYRVLSARSGLAALKLWNEHGKKADLLLTDLVMPDGVSGLDLLGHLREDQPGLRAILMSGYASPELSLPNQTAFIQKPYRPASLLKTIHDCLTSRAQPPAQVLHGLN